MMLRTLILAASLVATPLQAEGLIEKIGRDGFIANFAASGLDAGSTYRCSHKRKCEEGNPVMRAIVGKRMNAGEAVLATGIMQGIYTGGSYLIGETAGYDSPILDIFQLGSIGAHGVAAGLNMRF